MNARSRHFHSHYYPRRARWYSRLWYPWHRFQRAVRLDWIHLPSGLKPVDFLLGLIVPGHILRTMGFKKTGAAVMIVYVALTVAFVVALGFAASNIAFGLMISAHATSVALLLQRWLQPESLRWKMILSVIALAFVGLGVYGPLRDRILERFLPLRVGEQVIVVRPLTAAVRVGPGDAVAFRLAYTRLDGPIFLAEGYGIERVLAVAGSRVVFSPDGYEVDGERRPRLDFMPSTGQMIVPQKHFFVWPRLDIVNRAGPGVNVSGAILQIAMIHEDKIVGRPCRHWFGRRQALP